MMALFDCRQSGIAKTGRDDTVTALTTAFQTHH